MSKPSTKPLGWLVGLGVLLITLGVIVGLIGIFVAAKRKQKYRIQDENSISPSNALPAKPHSASLTRTTDTVQLLIGTIAFPSGSAGWRLSLQ